MLQQSLEVKLRITNPDVVLDIRREIFDREIAALASRLVSGQLTLGDWEAAMRQQIRGMHTAALAIGLGDWNDVTFSKWGRVGYVLRDQYKYLHGFAEALNAAQEEGVTVSAEAITARAKMYGDRAEATFNRAELEDDVADLLPAYPKDGSTICLTKCQCEWDIRKAKGGQDCYWRLGEVEHCETCLWRAANWAPVRIRGGEIEGTVEDYEEEGEELPKSWRISIPELEGKPLTRADSPDVLPKKAQEIWVAAFNGAYEETCAEREDRDACAAKIAWTAVKRKYKKVEGEWVPKKLRGGGMPVFPFGVREGEGAKGGPGSGNIEHEGRPGQVGGSKPTSDFHKAATSGKVKGTRGLARRLPGVT